MGVEAFQVIIDDILQPIRDVCKYFEKSGIVSKFDDCIKSRENRYYAYNDGRHLLEIEVESLLEKDHVTKVSCRFALCHPSTIDQVFVRFVKTVSRDFNTSVRIMEDVNGILQSNIVGNTDLDILDRALPISIDRKRLLWKTDFGHEEASLSCRAALKKYVLRQ